MPLNTIKTAIFDNDGVNINSEGPAMRICDNWLSKLVETFTPSSPLPKDYIYKNFAGKSTNKIAAMIVAEKSLPIEAIKETYGFTDEILTKIKKEEELAEDDDLGAFAFALADLITLETIEAYKKDLKSIYGITKMHQALRDLVGEENIYLATTSRADRMLASLAFAIDPETGKNADLLNTFKEGLHRLSGYGKANKYDLLFKKAEEAGEPIDPDTAVVIEDSKSGVEYAKAGRPNLRVVGTVNADFYTDKVAHAQVLIDAGASVIVSDMRDLPKILQWLDTGLDSDLKPADLLGAVYTPKDFAPKADFGVKLAVGDTPNPPEVK